MFKIFIVLPALILSQCTLKNIETIQPIFTNNNGSLTGHYSAVKQKIKPLARNFTLLHNSWESAMTNPDAGLGSGFGDSLVGPLASSEEDIGAEGSVPARPQLGSNPVSSQSALPAAAAPEQGSTEPEDDPLDGGILGPCPDTGGPICHCGNEDAHADPECADHGDHGDK
ncbi:MAG: hypothetical protein AAGD43_33535, partial [Pseudomonadota bacterium]